MPHSLSRIRREINATDQQMLRSIAARFEQIKLIAPLKHGKDAIDPTRERQLRALWRKHAPALGLSPRFASKFLRLILAESKRVQSS